MVDESSSQDVNDDDEVTKLSNGDEEDEEEEEDEDDEEGEDEVEEEEEELDDQEEKVASKPTVKQEVLEFNEDSTSNTIESSGSSYVSFRFIFVFFPHFRCFFFVCSLATTWSFDKFGCSRLILHHKHH